MATYVYAAEQRVRRGGPREFEYGSKWHRRFRFEIPVRARAAWSPEVVAELASTLGYLTDDNYEFGVTFNLNSVPIESYVTDDLSFDTPSDWEEVVLFSGGADSQCGAVLEILQSHRRVVLISHRPVSKVYARQRDLVGDIANLVRPPDRGPSASRLWSPAVARRSPPSRVPDDPAVCGRLPGQRSQFGAGAGLRPCERLRGRPRGGAPAG